MPVYEYCCPACARIFEKLVAMSAANTEAGCPRCGTPAHKLISTFAAVGSRESTGADQGRVRAAGGCCGGGCCGGGAG